MCDKIFSEKGTLKKHISSVHEGNKPFKCKFILNQDCSDTQIFLLDIKTVILNIH